MTKKLQQQSPEEFVGLIKVDDDGSVRIAIVNPTGPPSNVYSYKTSTGEVEVVEKFDSGEWIGQINLSPSLEHRAWGAAKNFIESRFGLPGTSQELERLIESRSGIKKQWWIVGGGKDGKNYPVSLPNLLALMKKMEAPPKDPSMAVIGNVTVAPHRQRQGFGLMLHEMAAVYLKQLGYKKMVSDLVGLNTTGEQAIWKKLRKDYAAPIVSFRKPIYPAFDILIDANVIDKKLADRLNATNGFYVDGTGMSLKKMQKKQFPQFELDLTDKRIDLPPPVETGSRREPVQARRVA